MDQEHFCKDVDSFPLDKFLQFGRGKGEKVLILGEAPAPNGWRKSGRAFYTIDGKLLPTGKNLNKLLAEYGLSVEICAFTELVKCFVGKDRKLLDSCGEKCWPIFTKQLISGNYNLIVLLGAKTLEIFNKRLGTSLNVGQLSKIEIENRNYTILPIYHPSPIAPFSHRKNQAIFKKIKSEIYRLI